MAFELIPFIEANPRTSIVLFAVILSFFISLINFFVLDKEKMREIKAKQKALQEEMKKHQAEGNHNKVLELQKEMMGYAGETLRHSFKPMLITIVPILIFFSWIKGVFAETVIAKTWFWYYIIASIASSIVMRKIFKLP